MNFENAKEICSFIKECSKLGVTKIKVGDLEVELSPRDHSPTERRSRHAASKAHANEQEGIKQKIEEDHELFMTQLAVDDPETFEALAVKGANGG